MDFEIKKVSITEIKSDILVVNLFEGTKLPGGATGAVDKSLSGLISDFVIGKEGFDGSFGKTYLLPTPNHPYITKVLIVGLGKRDEFDMNKLRELSAKVISRIKKFDNVGTVVSMLHGAGCAGFEPFECAKVLAEGTLIGGYTFDKYKSDKENKIKKFIIAENSGKHFDEAKEGLTAGKLVAEAVNYARELVNEPAQNVTPQYLATLAEEYDSDEVKIYGINDIKNMQMGAFAAVGQGSVNPPVFIHLEYKPSKAKKKIVLIGKGITFDSGGLDIKPAASMLTMKDDMSGAAAVLSIMRLIKKFKPSAEIHVLVAACENMPSGSSYKPGDILTAMNGKTIEVDNTDAEGRLTLADALCYANQLNPDIIIDIATLTGACMVALGSVASGILGNDRELIKKIIKCGERAGEKFWEMPMYKEYGDSLKSDTADTKNTGSRYGGTSAAAIFLKNFTSDEIPWAHIDIAGTAMLEKAQNEYPKGPTGAGIRTLIEFLMTE